MTNLPRILLLTSLVVAFTSLIIPFTSLIIPFTWSTTDEIVWEIDDGPKDLHRGRDHCNIPIIDEVHLSTEVFFAEYWRRKPLILRRSAHLNQRAQQRSRKDYLLKRHGHETVSLAGTQAFAFRKEEHTTLAEYFQRMKNINRPNNMTDASTTATNTTWDFANVTNFAFGPDIFHIGDVYQVPHILQSGDLEWHFQVAYASPEAGLTFHWHGDVFAETLHGHRRWFLMPPTHSPVFHPRTTSADWFRRSFSNNNEIASLLSCTLEPNHAIYVPADWWHAVISLGEAVSMTTSFPIPYRRDRYSLGGGHNAYMLDALEKQDLVTAIQEAQLLQQHRPNNLIPYMWLGALYTLAARRQASDHLQEYLENGTEATTRCIELNPWFGPCYVWQARQYNALALLSPNRRNELTALAQSATAIAAALGGAQDDELLDPRWQPKSSRQK